jgi:hypothetical protein
MSKLKTYSVIQIFFLFLLFGCGGGKSSNNETEITPIINGTWYKPPVFSTWQWQLSGEVNTSYNVDIYDIDLFDSSKDLIQQLQAANIKVICYFSAGSYEDWRSDANSFAFTELGNALDGWAGEYWLDIRSSNVFEVMKNRLDLAVKKGCDGVEPDNIDGYTQNAGFDLTAKDQLKFNRMLANEAHLRNLSIGLKNDLEQINDLIDYYDFAINEQCFQYSECDLLIPFINDGKAVFTTEYQQQYVQNQNAKDAMCTESLEMQFSTLILPSNLDDEFRISCL